MSAYVLHQSSDGKALSISSTRPESMPAGVAAATVTDSEFSALKDGSSRWNPATRTVVADTAKAQEQQEAVATSDRVEQVVAKARAILANPTGSPDWTAAERKVLLAVLLLRSR